MNFKHLELPAMLENCVVDAARYKISGKMYFIAVSCQYLGESIHHLNALGFSITPVELETDSNTFNFFVRWAGENALLVTYSRMKDMFYANRVSTSIRENGTCFPNRVKVIERFGLLDFNELWPLLSRVSGIQINAPRPSDSFHNIRRDIASLQKHPNGMP